MARPDQPLLILDSGVGGLSVLAETRALLPNAPIVYAADNAAYPYGTKGAAEIERHVPALLARLAGRFDPALIVIACNTASTIALDPVRAALHVPIVGTVPAIKPAALLSRTRAIGVLGAEAKLRGEPTDPAAYARILDGLLSRPGGDRVDTIVLACTHFPLVLQELEAAAPRPLAFVHGAAGIARRTAWLLRDHVWPDAPRDGLAVFTAPTPLIAAYAPGLAAYGLARIEML